MRFNIYFKELFGAFKRRYIVWLCLRLRKCQILIQIRREKNKQELENS